MELSEAEKKLLLSFRELGLEPKADNKNDLENWLKSYARQDIKQEDSKSQLGDAKQQVPPVPAVMVHPPRLLVFSGTSTGLDAAYDLWRFDVSSLKRSHPEEAVMEAVRRSLRGEAARVAMRMGVTASLGSLMAKFDSLYGIVQPKENILAAFYSARQKEGEDVASWSCRLEDLLMQAEAQGDVQPGRHQDEMLRTMFFMGLLPALKDRARHKYDSVKDFDQLRVEVRRLEQEQLEQRPVKKAAVHQAATSSQQATSPTSDSSLQREVRELRAEIARLKAGPPPRPNRQDDTHRFKAGPPQRQNYQDVTCFRCGEKGHIKVGCRMRLDHIRRGHDLNTRGPTGRDGL